MSNRILLASIAACAYLSTPAWAASDDELQRKLNSSQGNLMANSAAAAATMPDIKTSASGNVTEDAHQAAAAVGEKGSDNTFQQALNSTPVRFQISKDVITVPAGEPVPPAYAPAVAPVVQTQIDTAVESVQETSNDMVQVIEESGDKLEETVDAMTETTIDTYKDGVTEVKSTTSAALESAAEGAKSAADSGVNVMKDASGAVTAAGKDAKILTVEDAKKAIAEQNK